MSHRIACKSQLKEGSNDLVLNFQSPFLESKKEEAAHGGPKALCKSFYQIQRGGGSLNAPKREWGKRKAVF